MSQPSFPPLTYLQLWPPTSCLHVHRPRRRKEAVCLQRLGRKARAWFFLLASFPGLAFFQGNAVTCRQCCYVPETDNQSKKDNWDSKISSKGSNKPTVGKESRYWNPKAIHKRKRLFTFYCFLESVQHHIIFPTVATLKTIGRCSLGQDVNFQMSSCGKEGETSTA